MCSYMLVAVEACLKSCIKADRGRLKHTDHNTRQNMEINNWIYELNVLGVFKYVWT